MKFLLFLLLALPAFCADDLAGTYELSGVREVGSSLLLKVDGKFEYMFVYGAADYMAEGIWKRDGDFVVLNTSGNKGEGFRLVSSAAGSAEEIRVTLQGAGGQKVPNIDVLVQTGGETLKGRTDSDGIARFEPNANIKGIGFSIRVYSYESKMYPVNAAHRDFVFEINGAAITTVFFENERLPIDGKTLELRYWNKDRPMKYTKN